MSENPIAFMHLYIDTHGHYGWNNGCEVGSKLHRNTPI